MSLKKAILSGKEHRRDNAPASPHCKNHNACGYCRSNRTHRYTKSKMRAQEDEMEYQEIR